MILKMIDNASGVGAVVAASAAATPHATHAALPAAAAKHRVAAATHASEGHT